MELQPLTLEDAEVIRQERNKLPPGILRTPYMLTKEMQEEWYYREIADRESRTRYWGLWEPWPVDNGGFVPATRHVLVGYGGIENIEWENRSGEMSLLVFSHSRHMGFGQNAVKLFLHEAFNTLNLETVYAEVYDCNPNREFWSKVGHVAATLPRRKCIDGQYYAAKYYVWTREDI